MTGDTHPDDSDRDGPAATDVPQEQIEILWMAVESGYFRSPRETSISEIAARAGVTDVEASRLLRRGIENVLRRSDVYVEGTTRRGGRAPPPEPSQ